MSELHISLPLSLEAALLSRVAQGGYVDAPDYVRDLLRRDLSDYAEDRRRLKALVDEGIASGLLDENAFIVLDQIIAEAPDLRG